MVARTRLNVTLYVIACLVQSYRQTKFLHHLCNDSSAASISQFTPYPLRQRCLPSMTSSSMRLRWSRGSVLAFGTQVRGFKLGRSRWIFQGEKILSTPSFGGDVKPSVLCRRFTACKRFLNATWKSGISGKIHRPFLAHIIPPLATRISGETTSGESWNV